LLEKLEAYIAGCDRMIALVGDAYGFEPDEPARPAGRPHRFYTQWEYYFALGERLSGPPAGRKDIFVYFTAPDYLAAHPVKQGPEVAELQSLFIAQIRRSGEDRIRFSSLHELRALVLRDGFRLQYAPPPKPTVLPYPMLGRLFIGRQAFLDELRDRFEQARAAGHWPHHVLLGLGGVSKTRAAVEYGWCHRDRYAAVLFVNGESAAELQRALARLTGVLELNLDETVPEPQRMAAVLRWLGAHPGWLLIIDNVDGQPARDAVSSLLAQLSEGHVLTPAAAAQLLLEATAGRRRPRPDDAAEAAALATDLGQLCLALEQAAAYVRRQGVTLAEFRGRWQANRGGVRAWADKAFMKYHEEKEVSLSVATTWQTTMDQLSPGARGLLRLLAWLAPDPLARGLLEGKRTAEELRRVCGDEAVDVESAAAELREYSLLQRGEEGAGETAGQEHRLVQWVTRERQSAEERDASLRGVLETVNACAVEEPQDVRTWPVWEPLAPHVRALVEQADKAGISQPTARLMNDLGPLAVAGYFWGGKGITNIGRG
jgi:hypothetical protein